MITTLKKNHIHFLEQDNKHNFKIEFVGKKGIINTYTDNSNNHKILLCWWAIHWSL